MAQYWICPNCETASLTWPALRWHFKGKHVGEPIPAKEETQVTEELPAGYRIIGQYKKGVAAPVIEKVEGEEKEEPEITVIEELPREPVELFYTILKLKDVKDSVAKRLQMEFKLSPWMWGDAQEIASLLKGARISGISGDWIRSFLKQYGNTVELPTGGGEFGFVSGQRTKDEFFGRLEPREDSMTQLIRYQMWKDQREEEKVKEPKETRLSPALEARLTEQEKFYRETRDDLGTVIEKLDKEEREKEEAQRKAELAELRAEIRAMSEGKKGGEGEWLQAYLAERDKRGDDKEQRYQETIRDLGDKLAAGTKEIAETRREIDRKVADAITSERTAREQVIKELKADGWTSKTKSKEELDHEIQKTLLEVVPEKIDKGFDKLADKLGPLPGVAQAPQTTLLATSAPLTPQQIAEQAELEESILDEAKRRRKA